MMKSSSRTTLMLGIVIGMALAGTAFAQNGGVGNGNDKHHGGTPPAAPEPGLLLMAASGIALGGGYIMWRRKQTKHTPAT